MKSAPLFIASSFGLLSLAGCYSFSSYDYTLAHSRGAQLFDQHCAVCHHYAEDLKEPANFLEKAIHDGGQNMPSFDAVMTAKEQKILADYLANL